MSSNIRIDDEEVERLKLKALRQIQQQARTGQNQADLLKSLNGKAIDLTDSNFFTEVDKYPLMLIDFWAPWCGPCRMVSPTVDQLAQQYAGKIAFGRVNVDENEIVSRQFGIQSIPTLLIFQNGKAVDGMIGANPKNVIESRLNAFLGRGSVSAYR